LEAGHPTEPPEAVHPGWQGLVSAVKQFYQLTLELIQHMEKSNDDRDVKIEQMDALLDQREAVMNEMAPPYTAEEAELGKKLIQLNGELDQFFKTEKIQIQKEIKNLQAKKESNTKYVNPYQNLSTDGMFYDKRK
jgi:flagellar protein FliT